MKAYILVYHLKFISLRLQCKAKTKELSFLFQYFWDTQYIDVNTHLLSFSNNFILISGSGAYPRNTGHEVKILACSLLGENHQILRNLTWEKHTHISMETLHYETQKRFPTQLKIFKKVRNNISRASSLTKSLVQLRTATDEEATKRFMSILKWEKLWMKHDNNYMLEISERYLKDWRIWRKILGVNTTHLGLSAKTPPLKHCDVINVAESLNLLYYRQRKSWRKKWAATCKRSQLIF